MWPAQNPEVVAKIEEYLKTRPDRIGALADQSRQAAARAEGPGEVAPRSRCAAAVHSGHGCAGSARFPCSSTARPGQSPARLPRARTTATCNVACFRGPAGCPHRSSCSGHRMQPCRRRRQRNSRVPQHPPCIPRWQWQVSANLDDCGLSKAWWIFNEPGSVTI